MDLEVVKDHAARGPRATSVRLGTVNQGQPRRRPPDAGRGQPLCPLPGAAFQAGAPGRALLIDCRGTPGGTAALDLVRDVENHQKVGAQVGSQVGARIDPPALVTADPRTRSAFNAGPRLGLRASSASPLGRVTVRIGEQRFVVRQVWLSP